MHDKTLTVDGELAITGGRNMADEYFDYDHAYNFRDRDALVLGEAAKAMRASFERFWESRLSVPVEELYDGLGLMRKHVTIEDAEVQQIYRELHAYAGAPENFAPEVRAAIDAMPQAFPAIATQITWGQVEFISDPPGKNGSRLGLGGGGLTTAALARLLDGAREQVVIQSPYLVLSDDALELFRRATARGVRVRISTNSLASTDNLPAFSGYRNQRAELLALGVQIHEYRPDADVQRRQMQQRIPQLAGAAPRFSLHAKSVVIDSKLVAIGTFNLDPRSENLNTEVGAVIHDAGVARAVEALIENDMRPANSWNAATDDPDRHVPIGKRAKVRLLQWLPLRPVL
jgi:putative cardiolipin synthase